MSVTNIGNGGTLLQRAARLEKITQLGWILDLGVDPKALAEGEVQSPDDDDVVNISPVSIAIKKNNLEMWLMMMNYLSYANTTTNQYLELLFDIIEWAGPSAAKSPKDYNDFKEEFKDMLTRYPSVQQVSS